MKKILLTLIALFAILGQFVGGASAQGEELIINGNFEDPFMDVGSGLWAIFPSGSPGLGWEADWHSTETEFEGVQRPEIANFEYHQPGTLWSVYDGIQYTELDSDWDGPGGVLNGEPASIELHQHVPTCKGGVYQLNYAWSPRPNHPDNVMQVWWGDVLAATHSGAGDPTQTIWTPETWSLTATGSTTRLAFVEAGIPDSRGMFLDAISLIQTGECSGPDIDIKPGKYPNVVYLSTTRNIQVAILGSADFDVHDVDRSTLVFAGLHVRQTNYGLKCYISDVSGDFEKPAGAPDGYLDLTCVYVFKRSDFTPNDDGTATLTGNLWDGTPFSGKDALIVRP